MTPYPALRATALACLLGSLALSMPASADPGQTFHMNASVTATIPGMPEPIHSSFSHDVCLSKHHDPRDITSILHKNHACTISDYKVSDKQSRYHFSCAGRVTVSGDTVVVPKDLGGYHLTESVLGPSPGQTTEMVVDITPAPAICDYTPPPASPKH